MNTRVSPAAKARLSGSSTVLAERGSAIVSSALNQALTRQEIKREIDSGVVKEVDLRGYLLANRSVLTARAAAEQQRWISAAERMDNPREFAFKEPGRTISRFGGLATISGLLAVASAAVGLVLLTGGYVVALFRHSLVPWRQPGLIMMAVALLLVIVFGASSLLNDRRVLRYRTREYRAAEAEARREYETVLAELMLGALRNQINHVMKTYQSYDCQLRVKDAPGLAEVYSSEYWVESAAARQLQELLGQMRAGGTIGLAGPRGVGKTSLIRTKCPEEIHASRQSGDLALFVSAPVEYAPREFVLHLLATLCRAYLRFRNAPEVPDPVVPVPLIPASARVRGNASLAVGTSGAASPHGSDLVSRAQRYLSEIRYLQTYTTTLSGNVSLPAKIAGASGQAAAAAAQQPRSYPELVSEFCTFLQMIAHEVRKIGGHVFIGIDELDKISDGEQAQRFINELKAVLGIPYCYYLIAVSENALAAYEMRGLPVRDAFDSAFDEVIQLRHLRLKGSRDLLSKRVIGMSEPFVCLCQCLSGGLPRDLIRVARHVVAEGRKAGPGSDQLAMICGRLVANDLIRKLDATGIRWAGRRLPEPQSELLYAIQQIIEPLPDGNTLREGIQGILKDLATGSGRQNVGEDLAAVAELAGYLYYLVTLIEVFTQNLTKKQVVEGATGRLAPAGAFDQLCFARQTLATDSRRAWLTIDAFRKGWKLRPFAYPGAGASVSKLIAGSGPPTWHDAL